MSSSQKKFLPSSVAQRVPRDAAISPVRFGPLLLAGVSVPPSCRRMTHRQELVVETWWALEGRAVAPCVPIIATTPVFWGVAQGAECPFSRFHQKEGESPWGIPPQRWHRGKFYRAVIRLAPPDLAIMRNIELQLEISLRSGEKTYGPYIHPQRIVLRLAELPLPLPDIPAPATADDFRREIAPYRVMVLFMIRVLVPHPSGLETSSLRRAVLFQKYLGVEVGIVSHVYQCDGIWQLSRRYHGPLFNMYDYFQGIDRRVPWRVEIENPILPPMESGWRMEYIGPGIGFRNAKGKPVMYCHIDKETSRLQYVNYFGEKEGEVPRRDFYDFQGFRSSKWELDAKTGNPKNITYYRPDGSVAVRETYTVPEEPSGDSSDAPKPPSIEYGALVNKNWTRNLKNLA